jgi:hypothetical protein
MSIFGYSFLFVSLLALKVYFKKLKETQYLVPSARLELAKLSPLPPQDSVSTNFTTTAVYLSRELEVTMWLMTQFIRTLNYLVVYPETSLFFRRRLGYFCTILQMQR